MIIKKFFCFGLVILLVASIPSSVFTPQEDVEKDITDNTVDGKNVDTKGIQAETETRGQVSAYISHVPIRIDNNAELAAEASSGSGTPANPYIIEGYNIDGGGYGYCLYIGNTTDYFIVRNCYLHNASGRDYGYWRDTGLYFYNTEDGDAVENYVSDDNDHYGIYIEGSNNHTLENNNVSYNLGYGIYISGGSHILANNTASYNWDYGIYLDSASGNTLINNNASDNYYGIYLYYSNNNTLKDNTASGQYYGIYIREADNNTLMNNTASSNFDFGILISSSCRNTLTDNEMVDDGIVIYGGQLSEWNTHTIDTSNMVNGEPAYYWKNRTGGTIPAGGGQVILANCTGVTIENQHVSSANTGIELGYSQGNTVANNTANSNGATWGSINLWDSSNNRLINNTVSDSYHGITLIDSDDNNLTKNVVSDCDYGTYGIYLSSYCDNNLIYHNQLINNYRSAYDEGNDQWDNGYPEGGNYWSDYTGTDDYCGPNQDQNGSDGIGDTSYTNIYGGSNVDEYPLMNRTRKAIEFEVGWNYVSFPCQHSPKAIEDLLSGISWDKAMIYSNGSWQTYVPSRPAHYNSGFPLLNNTHGVWIHATDYGVWHDTITDVGETRITLRPGWNMIGYPSDTERTAGNTLPTEVTKIGVFNGSGEYNIEYIYDLTTVTMSDGNGYWVYNGADYSVDWAIDY